MKILNRKLAHEVTQMSFVGILFKNKLYSLKKKNKLCWTSIHRKRRNFSVQNKRRKCQNRTIRTCSTKQNFCLPRGISQMFEMQIFKSFFFFAFFCFNELVESFFPRQSDAVKCTWIHKETLFTAIRLVYSQLTSDVREE